MHESAKKSLTKDRPKTFGIVFLPRRTQNRNACRFAAPKKPAAKSVTDGRLPSNDV